LSYSGRRRSYSDHRYSDHRRPGHRAVVNPV